MKWIALILVLPFGLLAGALLINRPPLFAQPGLAERLKVYLTTNVAETREDHPFAELRTPSIATAADETERALVKAMESLGWQEISRSDGVVQAVVVSSLFRFRDDVVVRVEGTEKGSLLHARSASRVGKGDLAANARHLQKLFAQLTIQVGKGKE